MYPSLGTPDLFGIICQPKRLRSTCKCLFVSAAQELLNDLAKLASVPLNR